MARQIRELERKLYKLFGEAVALPEKHREPILDRIDRYGSNYEELTGQKYDVGRAFHFERADVE